MTDDAPGAPLAEPAPRRTAPPWLPLLVVLAAWVAHGSVLQTSGWVLDDRALVRDNPVVQRGPGGLPDAFALDAWAAEQEPGAWRPAAVASLALEAPLWRDDVGRLRGFGFHLTNLFLHGLAGILLLAVGLTFAPERWGVSAAAALLFAVHPLLTSAVSLLAGRADLLGLVFALVTILLWVRAIRTSPALLPFVGLAWLLALLSRETTLGLPLVLLAMLWAGLPRPVTPEMRARALLGLGVLGLALVVWVVLWPGRLGALTDAFSEGLRAVGSGALGVLLPVGLVSDPAIHALERPHALFGPIASALVLALAVLLLRSRRSTARVAGFGLLAFLILALVGALVTPPGGTLDSRFFYVTAPGLFFACGALLVTLARSTVSWARPARATGPIVSGLVLVGLAATTWHGGKVVYGTDELYHRNLLRAYPDRYLVQLRHARHQREEAEFERGIAQTLPSTDPTHRRLVASIPARLTEADALLRSATRRAPTHGAAWRELGAVALARGEAARASAHLKEGLRLDPWLRAHGRGDPMPASHRRELASTYVQLGMALEALGETSEAAQHYVFAARFAPGDPVVLLKAGVALTRARRFPEALTLLGLALEKAETSSQAERIRGSADAARRGASRLADAAILRGARAEETNAPRDALAAYEEAIAADPTRIQAYLAVARLRGEYFGDYRRGFAVLDDAAAVLDQLGRGGGNADRRRIQSLRAELRRAKAEEEAEERRLMNED